MQSWLLPLLFISGLLLVTSLWLVLRYWRLKRSLQSATLWANTIGTIIESHLVALDASPSKNPHSGSDSAKFIPQVVYSYTVLGIPYQSDSLCIDIGPMDEHSALRKLDQYRKGTSVTVFYNPRNPQQSVLETGKDAKLTHHFLLAILMLISALMVCCASFLAWASTIP